MAMTMSENSCDTKENNGKLQLGGERPLKKGPWTPEEDAILLEYLKKHGQGRWNSVQKYSGLARCAKSCRLRWTNHLNPNIKKGAFTPEEEKIIVKYHAKYGNKWARMATKLPGRTDNEIKNYWHTRMKRRMKQGLPLYPDSKEENWSPEHEPNYNNNNNIINDNNYNNNYILKNGSVSPSLRLNPNHNTPLSLSIPQHHHSPLASPQHHHHQLSPLHHHHISPSHSVASSPTQRLSLGQPFTSAYQSTLSLIDPASVAFTSFRSPPILSSPLGRFKKSEMHPITSHPLSPSSSIGQSSSPVLQSPYRTNAFLSPSLSFSLNSELPSSPFSQTATLKPSTMELPSSQFSQRDDSGFTFDTKIDFSAYPPRKVLRSSVGTNREFLSGQLSPRAVLNPTNASNIQLPLSRTFQTEDPKFTAGMNFQHHSSNISPATMSNYTTGFSTEVNDKSRLFEALISPHRVSTKRKDAIFDGFSQEEEEAQAEGKHGLIDALIQELDGNVYNTNTGHDFRGESLSEKERREESSRESSGREMKNTSPAEESRGDCLMREYLKTEDLLGKSSTKDGLISESSITEGLPTSKEPNSQLNGSDMVSRQINNIFTRSVSIGHWNDMNSDYCPEGEKEKDGPHEDEIIGMADELSSLLEYFPTTVQVPDWYRNSDEVPEDTSQGEMDINLGLEMQNASWNNLSGICQ